jgi:hypothetical protein
MSDLGQRLAELHTAAEAGGADVYRRGNAEGVGTLIRAAPAHQSEPVTSTKTSHPACVAPGFPKWDRDTVFINREETLAPVPREAWEWRVGGHQVCRKWLKDRKGRILTEDQIATYSRIVSAATETQRVVEAVDRLIDRHGGWPAAFRARDSL